MLFAFDKLSPYLATQVFDFSLISSMLVTDVLRIHQALDLWRSDMSRAEYLQAKLGSDCGVPVGITFFA
jgi:hypothetical protein